MAATINTNIASLNAQRNLSTSQTSLATSLQRLSSGLRINSAKDDAAGMAISDRMTSQIRGLNQASRNANDGISLTQVAEGAMSESSNILQRMRELSIQSANSTNTTDDRKSLQAEVKSLQSELTRIAQTTEFNGQRVLDGSFSKGSFQVGANANQTIDFAIGSVKGSSIGSLATQTGSAVAAATATDITVAVGGAAAVTIGSSANFVGTKTGQGSGSAYAKAAAINDAGIAGLTVSASTSGSATAGSVGGTALDTYSLSINGTAIYTGTDVAAGLSTTAIRDAINASSADTGVIASLNGGVMSLSAADGRDIAVTESGTGFTAGTDGLSVTGGSFAATLGGKLSVTATNTITIGGTVANVGLSASIAKDTKGIDSIDIGTAAGAQEAIMRIDSAMGTINTSRAAMGALQNRFQSTITSLATTSENLSAARGRILDTDFAAETANLTRGQILQQAGTAMLAQANSLPNGVMALLRG